ncbi:unnamed protein product [Candidula unifasciata]|uniref:Uncharacterized protein n=1 Tax=Candidula unifasciata TaxID=100452 RepID=A0A8S3ZMN8_9EUPU|nr:unnamed protein product [Candidula unifasciata]
MARNWDIGFNKKFIWLIVFATIITVTYLLGMQYIRQMGALSGVTYVPHPQQLKDSVRYKQQRDVLSRQLNLMKQAYGQQSCEQLKLIKLAGKSVDVRVSESGGWCSESSSPNSTDHVWDKGLSTALSKFSKGKTVGSFGDGPGKYKSHIDSLAEVVSYTAYDGAPHVENVTRGLVKFLDLTAPQYGIPAFDWVISLEVGEHIPAKYEDIYLDNLVRHAKEGIILSWATPGQEGLSHVNNKPLVDVVAQLNKRGFHINLQAGEPLRQASSFYWLKNNINVYYRKHAESFIPDDA